MFIRFRKKLILEENLCSTITKCRVILVYKGLYLFAVLQLFVDLFAQSSGTDTVNHDK